MRYWGKLTGAIIALLSGAGLWGLILGLFLGHMFDKARQRVNDGYSPAQRRQTLIFNTTFEVMGHLAKAKGRVTTADIYTTCMIMDRMNLSGNARMAAQNAFRTGKSARYPLRNKMRQLRHSCFGRFDLIRMFLEIQVEVAFANGSLHPDEQYLLYIICDELGISQHQFSHYIRSRQGYQQHYQHQYSHRYHGQAASKPDLAEKLNAACKILGVQPCHDATTIKRAYRKLMSQHHPDKLVAKGLPPSMMQLAKQKAQQIQQAYDVIKLAKGFK